MKKRRNVLVTLIISILFICQNVSLGQVIGDYQSVVSGNWIDITTWERYGASGWATPTLAEGYPGEFVGTGAVLIQTGNEVTLSGLGLTTQPMGVLTIESSAQLSIIGSNNLPIFTLNTPEINVVATPVTGLLYMEPQSILVLPDDAVIFIGPEGLFAKPCNNNIEIWIGSQQIAACKGAPGDIFTFGELLANGGTLNAITSSNSPVCVDGTINLFGDYSGAFGTTTPNGSIAGVNYSWEIQPPGGGSLITASTQDVTINNAIVGTYVATMTCLTYNLDQEYTNAETINVIVEPLPVPVVSGKNPVSTYETGVVYTTETGMSNYIWTVIGGTITAGGTSTDNTVIVSWGALGFGMVRVNYTTPTGCSALTQTTFPVSIVTKQSDANASWDLNNTWYPTGVPTILQDIIINDSVVIDNGSLAVCNNMTIGTGGRIQVDPTNELTVQGTLTNNVGTGGIVIKSDASGTGSLLHNTNNVSGTVEQYTSADAWHYISSSITGALSGVYLDIYLKPFDEPTDDWGAYIVPTDIPLNVMQGYSAWDTGTSNTVRFSGSLNNGDLSIGVTCRDYNPLIEDGGWNLVGNPYPSAIDWDAAGWTKNNIDNTIYFWKGDAATGMGNYHYYIGSGGEIPSIGVNDGTSEIPAMQGFFVHVIDDGLPGVVNGTLGVSNSVRIHSNQAYYKNSEENTIPLISLTSSDLEYNSDETIIRFFGRSSNEFDSEYDAIKLEGYLVPQLFSITPNQSMLAVNTLPDFKNGTIIPLGFKSPKEGEYIISLTQIENFYPEVTVYLEDLLTETMHNITVDPVYTFTSSPIDETQRFFLHLAENQSSDEIENNPSATIYSFDKTIYVQLLKDYERAVVQVFNLMGQNVYNQQIYGQDVKQLTIPGHSGYYVVNIQLGDQFVSRKVYIK